MMKELQIRLRTPAESFLSIVPVAVMMFFAQNPTVQETRPNKEAPTPLEVRISSPPQWEKGCLLIGLDRVNQSPVPVFLTKMGPYFYMALDVSTSELNTSEAIEWVNIFGESDLRTSDAVALAPGATVHGEFCLDPFVWVINLKKQTHREIPLRGKMRVDVSYFPTKESWERNKQRYNDPLYYLKPDADPGNSPDEVAPMKAKVFVSIPCSDVTCKSGCVGPPRGIRGEGRAVPDVQMVLREWDDRGRALTAEVAAKSGACSMDKPDPH